MTLDHVSLLGGWLPWFVACLAWGALLFGVAWWRRPLWQWTMIACASCATTVMLAWLVDVPARVGSTYPRSFLVWVALPLFACSAAAWQWPRVRWVRRIVAATAVPLLVGFGTLEINQHYGYMPTVGDVLGAKFPGEVSAQTLTATRADAPGHTPWHRSVGMVARVYIPGSVSQFRARAAFVWVPPVWFSIPRPRLPVLMLLHGTPGTTGDWWRTNRALTLANTWAAAHHGSGPLIVSPDINGSPFGDTECVGASETYLTVDVPTYLMEHFGVAVAPQRWAVAGMSEGGTCALDLVARHPDRFRTFGDFFGDAAPTLGPQRTTLHKLFGGSVRLQHDYDPRTWFPTDAAKGVEGFVAVGTNDRGYLSQNEQVAADARAAGMIVTLDIIHGGGHNWWTCTRALRDAYGAIIARIQPDATISPTIVPHAGPGSTDPSTAHAATQWAWGLTASPWRPPPTTHPQVASTPTRVAIR